ncbi:MAG: asparagine--tRNA ligase [Elusimicrobia bacterium CG1_02_63_36]|nr:MAG: asparagine--tRNA ligase [Elusimicrobia bacterium CG1_02_63_36]PIP84247.1 MAG: asparagine--tRNA ligase [Elusimicrobia bacterium CG22_combo_CG10-13_8_21_14_all_63_91]PJA17141.1 MAG: asparagine--tRNA ligase [Elusimicrobia bacterium CG_4_10_14_0_2_um_filter_63_34]PJB25512.1 MAG: asparagine--tRNA ligase [Elusimicrobia bacterium CG_4_9_14_3_um_filter_62_55]
MNELNSLNNLNNLTTDPVVSVGRIADHDGKRVSLKGWVYNKRSSKKLHFIQLRDGTGTIQCVVFVGDVPPAVFEAAEGLTQETSLTVTGTVRKDERSPIGFELGVSGIEVHAPSVDYPITPKEHGTAFLMDNRHLWLRSSKQHAIQKVRNEVVMAIRQFFYDRDFNLLDAPIFTPNACEGTTNLFETAYFEQKAYLTQSGQLYGEAGAMAFGKVVVFGPTFRAEKSKTRRHLTEFWMVEPEMAYCDLEQDMAVAEEFVEYVVQRTLERCKPQLKILERDLSKLEAIKRPFPRITYDDAVKKLQGLGMDVKWGDDFGGDEETKLAEGLDRPLMIHRYPAAIKAFYMKNDPENPKLALGVDMIAPEGYGEIIGGGQREDDYETLVAKIKAHDLPLEPFQWYLDLRRYGSVPHAGFGLGIERTVGWICGTPHVRETIPFPRTMARLNP